MVLDGDPEQVEPKRRQEGQPDRQPDQDREEDHEWPVQRGQQPPAPVEPEDVGKVGPVRVEGDPVNQRQPLVAVFLHVEGEGGDQADRGQVVEDHRRQVVGGVGEPDRGPVAEEIQGHVVEEGQPEDDLTEPVALEKVGHWRVTLPEDGPGDREDQEAGKDPVEQVPALGFWSVEDLERVDQVPAELKDQGDCKGDQAA